ncbi:MAG: hypothetical protein A3J10_03005 [Candidatus Sungbacteria bacterium RIFCSPLOWO2_02_FULL_54_10]|uniref:DUF4383 domain-containing protein n=1 Tax=Candidatus Sungbacteria bacterium RIFCSPLOWO2_01_FULL_54_21 TaxID=1802279 RepID=A0A1G2L6D3_9BACT|nr:MAG: hypothetical protein A2679_01500 [Candidatus Sungbacteria bacterium RIFCSPHIGHO2_01_FULL_54_26]OHA07094.1 MAG: hypothetical protein A3B34_02000 [Candidatus Sungbacteria bacterium RIFCSPLOWO2_01_FULL_54_21]OHA12101.1 MAG: hypothetical protein A3J10_03005 [Candidatus Sungbacteria bacterium RIFCSPLOWO2_02_FULL_54_10]
MAMNSKNFLMLGGIVLLVVGLAGMVGIIGPTPEQSIFGSLWWFDDAENWAHLVLGIAGLAVALAVPALQAPVTLLVGVLALVVGVWGFGMPELLGANLENPSDNILHLAVGAWALASWKMGRKSTGVM